jgi:hypothetical protein
MLGSTTMNASEVPKNLTPLEHPKTLATTSPEQAVF